MQVYRDLRIVTSRPSAIEETTYPHRLFGYVDSANACSAAQWAGDARIAIQQAQHAGHLPILVGGTGLYLRTLIDGIAPIPEIDGDIRATVRALPTKAAHEALVREDPEAAARLASNDATRIARALEVVRSTGRTLKTWQAVRAGGVDTDVRLKPLILLPPREWLSVRCDTRFDAMFDAGQDEVAALVARKLDPNLPAMRAIGVKEIAAFQSGKSNEAQARAAGKLATRQYAKRQYTWFRRQPPLSWPRIEKILDNQTANEMIIKLHE
jgi:tRNA dimethylallyltransferase